MGPKNTKNNINSNSIDKSQQQQEKSDKPRLFSCRSKDSEVQSDSDIDDKLFKRQKNIKAKKPFSFFCSSVQEPTKTNPLQKNIKEIEGKEEQDLKMEDGEKRIFMDNDTRIIETTAETSSNILEIIDQKSKSDDQIPQIERKTNEINEKDAQESKINGSDSYGQGDSQNEQKMEKLKKSKMAIEKNEEFIIPSPFAFESSLFTRSQLLEYSIPLGTLTDDMTIKKGNKNDNKPQKYAAETQTNLIVKKSVEEEKQREELFSSLLKSIQDSNISTQNSISSSFSSNMTTNTAQFMSRTSLIKQIETEQCCRLCDEDDFLVLEDLGSGNFGTVQKCLFKPINQEVAKKTYKKSSSQSEFEIEVGFLQLNSNEYIPKMIYFNRQSRSLYLELGMITLQDLYKYLKNKQMKLTDTLGVYLIASLLKINNLFYQKGIHHSDIKPANVIVCVDQAFQPMLKFIDFGAASNQPIDYWQQWTNLFVCPQLLAIYEKSPDPLSRQQIFYAECYASCRTVQLLMIASDPHQKAIFGFDNISQFLENPVIQEEFPQTLPILQEILAAENLSIDEQSFKRLESLILRDQQSQNVDEILERMEDVYDYSHNKFNI